METGGFNFEGSGETMDYHEAKPNQDRNDFKTKKNYNNYYYDMESDSRNNTYNPRNFGNNNNVEYFPGQFQNEGQVPLNSTAELLNEKVNYVVSKSNDNSERSNYMQNYVQNNQYRQNMQNTQNYQNFQNNYYNKDLNNTNNTQETTSYMKQMQPSCSDMNETQGVLGIANNLLSSDIMRKFRTENSNRTDRIEKNEKLENENMQKMNNTLPYDSTRERESQRIRNLYSTEGSHGKPSERREEKFNTLNSGLSCVIVENEHETSTNYNSQPNLQHINVGQNFDDMRRTNHNSMCSSEYSAFAPNDEMKGKNG